MSEMYVVEVRRTVVCVGKVVVKAGDIWHARRLAKDEAEEQSFAWSEETFDIETAAVSVPENAAELKPTKRKGRRR